jgi:hypothetical protein
MNMPEEKKQPRPHGDPLRDELDETNREENRAQTQSDASPDIIGEHSDRNQVPDAAEGEQRRRHYDKGADLVSSID